MCAVLSGRGGWAVVLSFQVLFTLLLFFFPSFLTYVCVCVCVVLCYCLIRTFINSHLAVSVNSLEWGGWKVTSLNPTRIMWDFLVLVGSRLELGMIWS